MSTDLGIRRWLLSAQKKLLGSVWQASKRLLEALGSFWEASGKHLEASGSVENFLEAAGKPLEESGSFWERRELPGSCWEAFGSFWKLLGRFLEASGKLLGNSWKLPGSFWEASGRSGRLLEKLLETSSWKLLGSLWEASGRFGNSLVGKLSLSRLATTPPSRCDIVENISFIIKCGHVRQTKTATIHPCSTLDAFGRSDASGCACTLGSSTCQGLQQSCRHDVTFAKACLLVLIAAINSCNDSYLPRPDCLGRLWRM